MTPAIDKARVLTEALPYIRKWFGKRVVIKVGGEVLDDPKVLDAFAADVVLMRFVGMEPIIVHGGGKQISETMAKFGKKAQFIGGHRVTDAETVDIVKMVLLGKINKAVVSAMNAHGGKAAGVSGEDGGLLSTRRITGPDGEDLGFVGEVEHVDPSLIGSLLSDEFIPVIAPVGAGPDGSYNINADLAAGAVAGALGAQKIVFLTNVPGLYRDLGDAESLISQIDGAQLESMLGEGRLSEGMIPKISAVVDALKAGVPQAHILDGRVDHALLLEVFTDEGVGTMVLP